jgi:tRNA nucleotidyltransferase (CCA-adding enzyme)
MVSHRRFGTCTIATENGFKIDLATARKETYEKPAALPTVKFSSIEDDLARRDFTMNAMAISINDTDFGDLIDFHNGRRDLADRSIKVMHDGSFIDDPTRILRAVRFESRFKFKIDRHTEELIKSAIEGSIFDKVGRERMRDELILMLQDRAPLAAIRRMARFEGLRFIHPAIKIGRDLTRLCGSIDAAHALYGRLPDRKTAPDKPLMYLMALFDGLTYNQVSAICNKLAFRRSYRDGLLSYRSKARAVTKLLSSRVDLAPSRIYKLLKPLPCEVVLLVMAHAALGRSDAKALLVRARIKGFLAKYDGMPLSISGDDLRAMGLKSGPAFKTILNKVLYGKMDGELKSKRDELAHARALAGDTAG